MFESTTGAVLLTDVKSATDQENFDQVTDAQLVSALNCEARKLWAWATRCNRNAFTTSASGSITSGNTLSMVATSPGLALSNFLAPRAVDVNLGGGVYRKILPWSFATRDRVWDISYRFLGEVMHILPETAATTYPYRIWYLTKPPTIANNSTAISLPSGGDQYIVQGVAAFVRTRIEEDPTPHLAEQKRLRDDMEGWLRSLPGDQGAIADVSDYDSSGGWVW